MESRISKTTDFLWNSLVSLFSPRRVNDARRNSSPLVNLLAVKPRDRFTSSHILCHHTYRQLELAQEGDFSVTCEALRADPRPRWAPPQPVSSQYFVWGRVKGLAGEIMHTDYEPPSHDAPEIAATESDLTSRIRPERSRAFCWQRNISTLYTLHLYTLHIYTLHSTSLHSTHLLSTPLLSTSLHLYTLHLYISTLYISTLYISTFYTPHSTLYISTLYISTLYTLHLYTLHSTLYISTLYISTLYISTLYISTLYTSTLYTLHLYTSTLYTSTSLHSPRVAVERLVLAPDLRSALAAVGGVQSRHLLSPPPSGHFIFVQQSTQLIILMAVDHSHSTDKPTAREHGAGRCVGEGEGGMGWGGVRWGGVQKIKTSVVTVWRVIDLPVDTSAPCEVPCTPQHRPPTVSSIHPPPSPLVYVGRDTPLSSLTVWWSAGCQGRSPSGPCNQVSRRPASNTR
ncbi:hypothetical protein C0Q70_02319 [Pomacea canaliculata]|uniref:Uncharacterized protein n=1 Tax=Pomacea canaliculata TaxID=400727 RepID=A0A2T7PPK8_POMCA|nr:hypothetical protein C0Q70_02319 [Pomacea canaliculata]